MTEQADAIRGLRRLLAGLACAGLAGCATPGPYERAGREAAAAIGAGDLAVHDSVSNFAANMGRTVRFAIAGDPIAIVPLSMTSPGVCQDGPGCADVLRRNLAYARGQSTFASDLLRAFAPCGLYAATDLSLNGVSYEPSQQFVQASVQLDRPVVPGEEEAVRAEVLACASTLAAEVGRRDYALDDVADWAARPVSMVVYLRDLAGLPAAEPPLIVGWQDAKERAYSAPTGHVMLLYLEDGRAEVTQEIGFAG